MPSENTIFCAFTGKVPSNVDLTLASAGRVHHFNRYRLSSSEQVLQCLMTLFESERRDEGTEDLMANFSRNFPLGFMLSERSLTPPAFIAESYGVRKAITRTALSLSAHARKHVLRLGYDLAVWDPNGETRAIFVVPMEGRDGFDVFRKRVKEASLAESLA